MASWRKSTNRKLTFWSGVGTIVKKANKNYEYFEYPGGGHNITGVYFNQAMERTVKFFKDNLK